MIKVDVREIVTESGVVEVDLLNLGQWRVRLWIAEKLFRLAAWIAWFDIDIEETEENDYG